MQDGMVSPTSISVYPMGTFFEDRCLVPGSRPRVPGTWDPVPNSRRGPDTESRGPNPIPGT
jgi:hypothetical protein